MTSFPLETFPTLVPRVRGLGGRHYMGGQGDVQYEALEYGKQVGMREPQAGGLCFKAEG